MSTTNRAAAIESLRLAAMAAYARADRAVEGNEPAEHVSELYAAAQSPTAPSPLRARRLLREARGLRRRAALGRARRPRGALRALQGVAAGG